MKTLFILFNLLPLLNGFSYTTNPDPTNDFSFFIGEWKGEGEFSNGKPIEATLSFEKELNNHWLKSVHKDVLPNKYEALSLWEIKDQSESFSVHIYDNFGSHRNFKSQGWVENEVILIAETANKGNWKWQKFIYEKTGDNSFKMTFEISSDGKEWKMIDYLNFKRV